MTARTAQARNVLVAALVDKALVLHAAAGSGTERLAVSLLDAGRTVLTPMDPANEPLIRPRAIPITTWAAYTVGRTAAKQ